MKSFFGILLILLAAFLLWIRFAPTDRDLVHIDPVDADDPGPRGVKIVGADAPRFPGETTDVLEAFAHVALEEPRVKLLDGDFSEAMMTFVARTKVFGFRDYITVKATQEGEETKLSVISRSRYNFGSDWGVNRDRLDRWLGELERRLRK
ncbi:MAG: DUF1499 domain-containing protein [Boseongicola sp.]|nr:DUF1499 domain-containing protein [Boseongicola sp.]MDD9977247.1 DUF1499 domain-containing protein [Boseongicola sp.]